MKEQNFTFESFRSEEISDEKQLQIKGGYTRLRRNRRTTVVPIWDEVEVRRNENAVAVDSDLTLRIVRRGG